MECAGKTHSKKIHIVAIVPILFVILPICGGCDRADRPTGVHDRTVGHQIVITDFTIHIVEVDDIAVDNRAVAVLEGKVIPVVGLVGKVRAILVVARGMRIGRQRKLEMNRSARGDPDRS